MKKQILALLAQQGQQPVIGAIDNSIRDFKKEGYQHFEIKESIRKIFFGIDGKIDKYIISKGL